MGSAGCGHSLCKGCRTMPTLDYISAICFAQAPGACRKRRNDNFILKKIFANAICSLYMKSNEQNGRSCLLKEPCRATLFCFPTEVRMQSAFVPVVKTLELSGASKREQVGLKKNACMPHGAWYALLAAWVEREIRPEGSQPGGTQRYIEWFPPSWVAMSDIRSNSCSPGNTAELQQPFLHLCRAF